MVPSRKTKGGNATFGYEYLSPDYVVIWSNGRYIRIHRNVPPLTTQAFHAVMSLIGHVDFFDTLRQSFPAEYREIAEEAGIAILCLLTTVVPFFGFAAAIGALYLFVDTLQTGGESRKHGRN